LVLARKLELDLRRDVREEALQFWARFLDLLLEKLNSISEELIEDLANQLKRLNFVYDLIEFFEEFIDQLLGLGKG